MKKTISIIFSALIIIMLTACSNNLQPQEEPPPLDNNIYCFDSVSELETFLHNDSIQDREGNVLKNDAEIKEKFGTEFSTFKNAFDDGENKLKIPYFADNSEESKNKNEYESIMVFTEDLYNLPWIWYRFEMDSGYVTVRTSYIGDVVKESLENATFSEFLKQFRPNAPNIHNYSLERYPEYKDIYGIEMSIGGKKTSTLVYETQSSERVFVLFAYEDMIVVLVGNEELLSDGFLENLTFSEVAK